MAQDRASPNSGRMYGCCYAVSSCCHYDGALAGLWIIPVFALPAQNRTSASSGLEIQVKYDNNIDIFIVISLKKTLTSTLDSSILNIQLHLVSCRNDEHSIVQMHRPE